MALPITTIPPFGNTQLLPACATGCGPLYNANGACVPPGHTTAAASVYTQCFCSYAQLAPFSTGSTGVCAAGACTASSDLASIQTWFQSICNIGQKAAGTTATGTGTSTGSDSTGTASSSSSSSKSNNGDWLSGHWQWVIMLVVLVVAIAGIWTGACIWRRRHLRKKDRQTSLGQKQSGSASRPSWGPGVSEAAMHGTDSSFSGQQSMFSPGLAAADEKPRKTPKKWRVTERT